MGRIRVLVVDDSALARGLIIAILSVDSDIEVVGEAEDGLDAIAKVASLKPDIVTMDIEMPVMNGMDAIERIMATHAVPILVVTSLDDADIGYSAIAKGALDVIRKPDVSLAGARDFIDKVKILSKIRVITHLKGRLRAIGEKAGQQVLSARTASNRIVAIAASTGGPQALSVIVAALPKNFPSPVVVAQHIADGFAQGMVEWFSKITMVRVRVAAEGEVVVPGTVYVSPSESHMEINSGRRVVLRERSQKDLHHPSCDALLSSVARVYGSRSIGVILSGMGSDGVMGMKQIKDSGGVTIAQDKETSIVFGMPQSAIASGCIDRILPPEEIGPELVRLITAAEGQGVLPGR